MGRNAGKNGMFRTLLGATALVCLAACAGGGRPAAPRQATQTATPRPAPSPRTLPTPPPVAPDAPRARGEGLFDKYKFTYERTGDETVAEFAPLKLPYVDAVVVGAGREVIFTVYGERMENFPRRVPWRYGDSEHAIKLAGDQYDYVFVHLPDDRREIPRLVFWRVPKGTVE